MFANLSYEVRSKILSCLFVLSLLSGGSQAIAAPACDIVFKPEVVTALTQQKTRPENEDIERADPEAVWRYLEPKIDAPTKDPRFFKVLEASTMELLKTYEGQEIFFVARDGEWFYDAMTTVLRSHAKTEKLAERMHLLNLSRPIANNADGKTLMKYLIAHGLDPARIMTGEKKVLLIDTGERGSIFVNVLQKIVSTYKFDNGQWQPQVTNLLKGFEVKLLHSSMKENRASIINKIKQMKEFDSYQISDFIDGLGFGTIISGQRKAIGLPGTHHSLHDWIVETFERRKHWTGRASQINGKGEVTMFENVDQDRTAALYNQAQILDHFSKDAVLDKFSEAVGQALSLCGSSCKKTPTPIVQEKPKEKPESKAKPKAEAIILKAGLELKVGQIVITKAKAKYEVIKFIDAGKRGRVYEVKSLADGETYALKIAIDKSADTLKSFSEEAEKNKGYKLAGIAHAKVIELGSDYMVKEFVKGTRAFEWLQAWVAQGKPSGTPQLKNLKKQLEQAASRGIYIGDLNPKNLIWTGKKWVLVDSGTWREDLSEAEVLGRYDEKVIGRWAKHHSSSVENALRSELDLR